MNRRKPLHFKRNAKQIATMLAMGMDMEMCSSEVHARRHKPKWYSVDLCQTSRKTQIAVFTGARKDLWFPTIYYRLKLY